jgi:methylenetetrahydrofolate--tRNA-(uracil-5-)-methyltransferase
MMNADVRIIGGGLAGCEAAWQIAQAGFKVVLYEMRPEKKSPAHDTGNLAELVCSNSFRSNNPETAVGLIKEEMRRVGSMILNCAEKHAVPAGDALAMDRDLFSAEVTSVIDGHPNIEVIREEVDEVTWDTPTIIATGPLTSDSLAAWIVKLTGADRLYFYDAIAPIIDADSIDTQKVFAQSRYDKGESADYLNCPFNEEEYLAFVQALVDGEKMPLSSFEKIKYFQACLPAEVMAERGPLTLAFGPMKPVGLTDPSTGERPYAVLQLRKENASGTAYNMVGFQTKLKYPEQKRIFRMIPGLENAEFLRMGSVHRNTYLNGPRLLDDTLRFRGRPQLRFAGQITGVEGYVESSAVGMLAGLFQIAELRGENPSESRPPAESALGSLLAHITEPTELDYQPTNINYSLVPAWTGPRLRKREKKAAYMKRALLALDSWIPRTKELQSP